MACHLVGTTKAVPVTCAIGDSVMDFSGITARNSVISSQARPQPFVIDSDATCDLPSVRLLPRTLIISGSSPYFCFYGHSNGTLQSEVPIALRNVRVKGGKSLGEVSGCREQSYAVHR